MHDRYCSGFICSSQKSLNYVLTVLFFTGTERSAGPRSHRGPAGGPESPGSSDTNGMVDASEAGAGEAWDGRECCLHQEQSVPEDPKGLAEGTARARGQSYREMCGLAW